MKNLKLGGKIGGGFGMLILIALILGGLAILNMSKASRNAEMMAEEYAPEVRIANELERNYLLAMLAIRSYALSEDRAYLKEGRDLFTKVRGQLGEAKELAAKSSHLVKLRSLVEKIEAGLGQYEKFTNDTENQDNVIDGNRQKMDAAATQFMDNCASYAKSQNEMFEKEMVPGADPAKIKERVQKINHINEIMGLGNAVRVANFKGQATNDFSITKAALPNFDKIDKLAAGILAATTREVNIKELGNIRAAAKNYHKAVEDLMAAYDQMGEVAKRRNVVAAEVLGLVQEASKAGITNTLALATEAENGLNLSVWVMVAGLIVALLLGVVVAVLITKSITTPVRITVDAVGQAAKGDFSFSLDKRLLTRADELGEMLRDVDKMAENLSVVVTESTAAAETVATSAAEISQGNQDLSERTQQQASAIEETASSIEEMTSSVKQNASNSQQANDLARRTSTMAVQGGQMVERTVGAMAAVTESSRKISDIINVVNEIAFQTNLLALNAAVEAARAGEAGRGFAVVAGEVRNLAGRSAAAAKEIQALITDSVAKVEQGNELVAESGSLLKEIITSVQGVADTVAEITAAGQEQASGIDEINRAVTQMDEAVQQNAALVEEAASASENMAAAAEQLRSQMRQFKVRQMSGGQTMLAAPRPPAPAPKPLIKSSRPAAPVKAAAPAKPAAKPAAKSEAKPAAKGKDDFFDTADLEGFEEF